MPRLSATVVLYAALAVINAAAFVMSFAALKELAEENAMAFPALFPLLVDAGAIALAVAAFNASIAGRDGTHYSALVLGFTGISAMLNVMHVWSGPDAAHVLKYFMHAMPPVVSFVVLEVLLAEVRHSREAGISAPSPRQRTTPATDGTESERTAQPKRRGRRPGVKTAIDENGQPITHAQIAKRKGVPLRTYFRHLARGVA